MRVKNWVFFAVGLLLILAYWYSVHPMGFARGYSEDWCHPDITRQLISDSLQKTGNPGFHTQGYAAPYGTSLPYMSWGIELSWLGSFFWRWNRDFPFQWFYFGLSLVGSYLGVGYILRRMRLSAQAAWGLATLVVLAHIPRHFKIWHHYEHLLQHWVYWSLFLDAWIWHRFWRERRWSWSLEAWRALCLLGMLDTAGYFWGPLILEWLLVRACIGVGVLIRRRRGAATSVEGSLSETWVPILLGLFFAVTDFRWFMPLKKEVQGLGEVTQYLGWFTPWPYLIRPLWLDGALRIFQEATHIPLKIKPYTHTETVVTVGWFLWIPAAIGLARTRRSRGGPGMATALPFLLLLAVAVIYITMDPPYFQSVLQAGIPFMKFFRVASRWGLFLPQICVAILALCWPEFSAWVREARIRHPRRFLAWGLVFVGLSLVEISQLLAPVSTMPPISDSAKQLLEGVKEAPGSTVLDLPFCMAGGNGACTGEQCPNYPAATMGGCLRGWHDKNVYGIYASRLVETQCQYYHQAPYLSWFDAWRNQRCFTEGEWQEFCRYLTAHPELSAILVYPEIWTGAADPQCRAQLDAHLGPPIAEANLVMAAVRGNETPRFTRLWRYAPRCR